MQSSVQIRRFSVSDAKQVKGLISEIMAREFHEAQNAYPVQDLDDISSHYGRLGEAFFVAYSNGKVIGTVAIKKEDERTAFLRRLFVSAPFRNQRLGAKLIRHAISFCDEVGYEEVIFKTTSRMEGANKTCQRCGFVQRAKLGLGPIELLKFTLLLKNGVGNSRSK